MNIKKPVKILVIEDDPKQARYIEALLLRHGEQFIVDSASSAEKGIHKLLRDKYDAVTLDFHLPQMNGIKALEIIRSRQIDIPIIMVTGQGDELIAVQAMKAGAADYITKSREYMELLPQVLLRAIRETHLSKQLEQSKTQYRELFQHASLAIFVLDAETFTIQQVNRHAVKLFGYQKRDVANKPIESICYSPHMTRFAEFLQTIIQKGTASLEDLRLLRKDRRVIPTDITGSYVTIDDHPLVQLFVRDISERLHLQRQISLSRQRLISVFNGITDPICVLDSNYKLVMGNKQYLEKTNTTTKSLAGKKCHQMMFGRDKPCDGCPAQETLLKGTSEFVEMYHDNRIYDIWTFPMTDLDGKPEFVVEYIKDVTEQKEMERQFINSEKLATIGLLSSGIAHELRNPLNIIETSRYAIETELNHTNDNVDKKLEQISNNVRRSSFIIDNLLHFARHSDFDREKINIESLIKSTLSLIGKEMENHNIECKTSFIKAPKVYFNIDSLKQVFLNVIMNAIQSMPNGGSLQITTAISEDETSVYVNFTDTGVGISQSNMQNIFTPFFTTRGTSGGTGLGLYLSQTIINREGGEILVKSSQGNGTTFTIKLPVAKPTDKNT